MLISNDTHTTKTHWYTYSLDPFPRLGALGPTFAKCKLLKSDPVVKVQPKRNMEDVFKINK